MNMELEGKEDWSSVNHLRAFHMTVGCHAHYLSIGPSP